MTAAALPHAAAREGDPFEFRSGVVVDAGKRFAYLMSTAGGIDALDLRTGRAVWTAETGERPLLLLGHTLVAQATMQDRGNILRLVLLDAERSGARRNQIDVELPEEVRATVDDGPGTAFRVRAWPTPHGMALAWTYSALAIRAMPGGPPEHVREGTARINLETGKVVTSKSGARTELSTPMPAKLARLSETGSVPGPLWRSGDAYVSVARIRESGAERAVLKRWRAVNGDPLPEVELYRGKYTIRYPSADQLHLLVSRLDRAASQPAEQYEWLIFSLSTGEQVAKLHRSIPAAWFFISESLLVHEAQPEERIENEHRSEKPRSMRAIDLRTGVERWVWPLRDTAYHGPLPPGRRSGMP